jgi:hypothetical protein
MENLVVKERRLGKEKARGLYHEHGLIEIDPRLPAKEYLEVLIHEFLHLEFKHCEEEYVKDYGIKISEFLWSLGYRKVNLE